MLEGFGRVVVACSIALLATPARADVYGFVDADGTVHLATEPVDARYALFLKTNEPGSSATDDDRVDPTLARTRLFQRLVDDPRIARYEPLIRAAAARHGLDADLVKAVVAVESGFDPAAVSDKGAVGLMQVLPATGERYGVRADRKRTVDAKLADPTLNVEIGTRYLADLGRLFPDRRDLALAAYNAGENAVLRFNRTVPPFPETQAYVKLVDQFQAFYRPKDRSIAGDVGRRIRVTIPARRNLPDPTVPLRLGVVHEPVAIAPAPGDGAARLDDTTP